MHRLALWLGAAAALPLAGYVTANATGIVGAATDVPTVNRALKGARLPSAASSRVATSSKATTQRIATVEVVGVDDAAIIYRDHEGRVLFQTDPVSNKTIVVRGLVLPTVTVRETARTQVRPVVIETPASATQTPTPDAKPRKLMKDCEPAASPLSASGASERGARCFVDAAPRRYADAR